MEAGGRRRLRRLGVAIAIAIAFGLGLGAGALYQHTSGEAALFF